MFNETDFSLYRALEAHSSRDIYPMHMPGHKRNGLIPSAALPWSLDITEIDGFDNLHDSRGILLRAQNRAAGLWGSDEAHFLINGSTGGILAGIHACTAPEDRVLIARNCHKSVYHAVELLDLRPVYLEPPVLAGPGICGSISPAAVERALRETPGIRLAVITSPTYEGVLSDVQAIAHSLHNHNIPLLVDEAHGAHLGLSPYFPSSAISQGADLVIHSLHKTLISLTQTAVAHRRGALVSGERLRHSLGLFQSSSPSYLLLASIDSCVGDLLARGDALLSAWHTRLEAFHQAAAGLARLALPDWRAHPEAVFAHDPGKLVILCRGTGLTGGALCRTLLENYGVELEMAQAGYALAMTGLGDTPEGMARLAGALTELDRGLPGAVHTAPSPALPPMPPQVIPSGRAMGRPCSAVPFGESVGRISGEYIWAYPPGIPLVTPGQRITPVLCRAVGEMASGGVEIRSTFHAMPETIRVLDE